MLDLLDLTSIQDAIIGTTSAGLNLEQRKRVTIAVEVVSRPAILFCDEPTTALDTKSALRVVKLLRRLARTGLAVICTIHQPVSLQKTPSGVYKLTSVSQSSEAFNVFDDLLLLQRGGKQVYFGPRRKAVEFFTNVNNVKGEQSNPADFLLDVAGAGVDLPDDRLDEVDLDPLAGRWKASSGFKTMTKELETLSMPDKSRPRTETKPASIGRQCYQLTRRVTRHYWRDPSFSYTKIFTSTVVPFIIGFSFFQVGREHTIVSLQNRMFSTFLLLFVPVVWLNVIIFKIFRLRGLWEARERPSKIYGRTAFVTSLLVSEVPYSVACATSYWLLWYFLTGFPIEASPVLFCELALSSCG